MKKTLFLPVMLLIGSMVMAQSGSSFGIKAGLNYNGNGDYIDSATNAIDDPERKAGFHVGIWGKLGNRIYVRPELVYTSTTSDYQEGDLKIQKLDVPVLAGIKIVGPLHTFIGPSFQYLLNTKFADTTFDDIESDFTVGLNVGVGVNLAKFGIDIRYERGFTENEVDFVNANVTSLANDRVDTRPHQLIISFSMKL